MVHLLSLLFILSLLSNGNALRGRRYLQDAPTTSPTTVSTSIAGLEDDPGVLGSSTSSTAAPEAPVSWFGEESIVATTTDAPLESAAATILAVTGAPDPIIGEEGEEAPADISSGGYPVDNSTETVRSTTIATDAPAVDEGATEDKLGEAAVLPTGETPTTGPTMVIAEENTMSTEANIDATLPEDSGLTGDAGEGADVDDGSNSTDASFDSESTTSSTQNSETAGLAGDLTQSTETTSATPGSTTPTDDAWFTPNDDTNTTDDAQKGWNEGDDSIDEELYYEGDDGAPTDDAPNSFNEDDDFEGDEWSSYNQMNDDPTYQPTPRPTHHAYESPSDDLVEESYTSAAEFDDDLKNAEAKIENAEDAVETYLSGVESPEEMEQDKNVQVVAGVLTTVFLVLWLITAHQTMENPDGLCAR
jgi:hypothetical protein